MNFLFLSFVFILHPSSFLLLLRAAAPTAYAIPAETTSEQSGYFSIVEGPGKRLYIGTAKYRVNAYLVEFDLATHAMKIVVDAQREIGTQATGFAAQAKIHTRNNVGPSGKIYFGTKQGYPADGEKRSDYRGGYPMVYDPSTGKTRVYGIPVAEQGIISLTPDESRGLAYLSTSSDSRPLDSTHFMILDLASGKYRDLLDCQHMYAFIVLDHLGRAYHPIVGGDIARFDPATDKLERLKQTIDGQPPTKESLLADPETHPINWEISPDRQTLWAVAMSGNALYSYDLTATGDVLSGRNRGKLIEGAKATDCRAMCVGPDGTVWAGINVSLPAPNGSSEKPADRLHLVSYYPGDGKPAPATPGDGKTIDGPRPTPPQSITGQSLSPTPTTPSSSIRTVSRSIIITASSVCPTARWPRVTSSWASAPPATAWSTSPRSTRLPSTPSSPQGRSDILSL